MNESESSSSSSRKVQQALAAAGIATRVVELPQSAHTAAEAAAAIGCRLEQIAKSLVFRRQDSGEPVLVIASGGNRVNEQQVARHLGAAIDKADAGFVRALTGFAIGGVPPLGHDTPLRTLVDEELLAFDAVWAAAGTPRSVFSISPAQLVAATGAAVIAVAADDQR